MLMIVSEWTPPTQNMNVGLYPQTMNLLQFDYPAFQPWAEMVTGGDSGGAVMMLVNGDLVLLTTFWTAGGGVGIEGHAATLETQMRSLAAAQGDNYQYTFSRADLSSFTSYA